MEIPEALTFDDVLLEPRHSSVLPKETIVSTQLSSSITLGIPLIASAMDTVSEYKLAIAMAQSGGMACIHKNMSAEEQANQIKLVKRFESGMVIDPITIDDEASLFEATELMKNHKISGILVVNKNLKLVGILTNRDVRFVTDKKIKVKDLMTKKLITAKVGTSLTEAKKILFKNKIEKLIIVDNNFKCKGLVTVKDIQKSQIYPEAAKDKKGSLVVAAAVGTGQESFQRAEQLAEAGADVIVLDTAHGHSVSVLKTLERIKKNIEFINLIENSCLHIGLRFYDQNGSLVFATHPLHEKMWHGKPFPKGTFKSTCIIPDNLLNDNIYNVTLVVVKNENEELYIHENIFHFQISDAGYRGDSYGKWPGAIRPQFVWSTEIIN